MSILDAPEVIERARKARHSRQLLRWGVLSCFAFIWMAIIFAAMVAYLNAPSNADAIPGDSSFFLNPFVIVPFSIIMLIIFMLVVIYSL